jgi:hypothetical protein
MRKAILILIGMVMLCPISLAQKKKQVPVKKPALPVVTKPSTIEPENASPTVSQPVIKNVIKSPLPDILDVMPELLSVTSNGWLSLNSGVVKGMSFNEASLKLSTYLEKAPEADNGKGSLSQFEILKKDEEAISKLLESLSGTQKGLMGFTLPLLNDSIVPFISIVRHKNENTFIFFRTVSPNDYNTLRVDTKQRAAKTISASILPILEHFINSLSPTNYKYFGMVVGYGSENFLNKDKRTEKDLVGEAVALIVSFETARKFVKGGITDDDLVQASDVYLIDRDMKSGIKKITLKLE